MIYYPFMFEELGGPESFNCLSVCLSVCLFVCLSVCPDLTAYISETTGPIFLKFGTLTGSQVRLIVLKFRNGHLTNNR